MASADRQHQGSEKEREEEQKEGKRKPKAILHPPVSVLTKSKEALLMADVFP